MITAAEAGKALCTMAELLLEHEILTPEGYSSLARVGRYIQGKKSSGRWEYEVDRGEPILFSRATDKNGNWISICIVADGVSIDQENVRNVPFRSLDIAIEIHNLSNDPISRWHLDLANCENGNWQSGPLVHLQYGGHNHGARHLDHQLKTPRWCHPPMEVALLCEVVAANFFEESWVELRENPTWCSAISKFEKICFADYLKKIQGCLNASGSTALKDMWAGAWI